MDKRYFFIVANIFFFLIAPAKAQITFQKIFGSTFDDIGQRALQTTDGGYIMVGTKASPGDPDILVVRLDAAGDTLWTKTYDKGGTEQAYDIKQTFDGGFIIAGTAFDPIDFTKDGYVIKIDATGGVIWSKVYEGSWPLEIRSVEQTSDSGYIYTGLSERFFSSWGDDYLLLIKTNAIGDTLWTLTTITQHLINGSGNDAVGLSVKQTQDGGYVAAGQCETKCYIVKTTASGNIQWTRFLQAGTPGFDDAKGIAIANDGGIVLVGYSRFSNTQQDIALVKIDTTGSVVWSKCFGGSGVEYGFDIDNTQDGGFIICGSTNIIPSSSFHDILLLKTDSLGEFEWSNVYGGANDEVNPQTFPIKKISVQQTNDGGFLLGGSTKSFGAGDLNFYLLKTDSLGISGCNQTPFTPIVTLNTHTTVTPPNIVVYQVNSDTCMSYISGSGTTDSTLCLVNTSYPEPENRDLFSIYPNPATSTLKISGSVDCEVQIFNIVGVAELKKDIRSKSGNPIALNISDLKSGIYFIRCGNVVKKFIKQ